MLYPREIYNQAKQAGWLLSDGRWRDFKVWNDNRLWIDYESALYIAYSVPFEISVNTLAKAFRFHQLGSTNNPTLTCFRGTNYDFIINTSISLNTFVLRASINDTVTTIPGVYNHTPGTGISIGRVLFTPEAATPNEIYYQSTDMTDISGKIVIKDYE